MRILDLLERYVAAYEADVRGRIDAVDANASVAEALGRVADAQTEGARVSRESLAKPHRHLHFAGEHTRRLEVGMEAAMESGERAALEVMGVLG